MFRGAGAVSDGSGQREARVQTAFKRTHKHVTTHTSNAAGHSPATVSAAASTARLQLISAAPPPYTIALERTRLRATHSASCRLRFVSSII